MSEKQVPETPIAEDEEQRRKKMMAEDEDTEEGVEKHFDRIYRAIGELIDATKTLAENLKSVSDTNRSLIESVKGEMEGLKSEFKKFTAGFSQATAAHKKHDKFDEGEAKPAEAAEEVTYPPEELRERGKAALEKSLKDVKKAVTATTPRPAEFVSNKNEPKDASLVRGILAGEVKPGDVIKSLGEVLKYG